jgi:hemolysin III
MKAIAARLPAMRRSGIVSAVVRGAAGRGLAAWLRHWHRRDGSGTVQGSSRRVPTESRALHYRTARHDARGHDGSTSVRLVQVSRGAGRSIGPGDTDFPSYTAAETAADRIVHLIGAPAGIAAACWLVAYVGATGNATLTISLLVYGCGLVGMLAVSAAYNLSRPGRRKELLRRADHAMIYVMIAGSYTPFAANVLRGRDGLLVGGAVWLLAAIGIGVKLAFPRRFERLLLALYLGMGWIVLSLIRTLMTLLPREVFLLLVLGGVAYTFGALLHSLRRVPFHNVAWHVLVLVGAGLHLTAMAQQFAAPK